MCGKPPAFRQKFLLSLPRGYASICVVGKAEPFRTSGGKAAEKLSVRISFSKSTNQFLQFSGAVRQASHSSDGFFRRVFRRETNPAQLIFVFTTILIACFNNILLVEVTHNLKIIRAAASILNSVNRKISRFRMMNYDRRGRLLRLDLKFFRQLNIDARRIEQLKQFGLVFEIRTGGIAKTESRTLIALTKQLIKIFLVS